MAVLGQQATAMPDSLWARAVPWSEVEQLHTRIGRHFARAEPRERALNYLLGLLAPLGRKNGRRLADFAEERRPDGMQRLLTRAKWSADGVRDDLQDYINEGFGHPAATLILAEATFEKRGSTSAGLGSHYDPLAGRFVKSQLGLFLAYQSPGRPVVLADRRLCAAADHPAPTKAFLAEDMVVETRQRLPFRWLAGSDVYGTDRALRAWLEQQQVPYMFAIPSSLRSVSADDRATVARQMSDALAGRSDPWYRPEEDGSTVALFAPEWARLALSSRNGAPLTRFVLLRRDRRSRSLACFICCGPADAAIPELASVATAQGAVDVAFQIARRWAGLDQYQVRGEEAWYRHVTLAMVGHACLATVVAHQEETRSPAPMSAPTMPVPTMAACQPANAANA
jgi:SRSO17 transposase